MLKCFIDTETTGLNATLHSVHQVAAILLDSDDKEVDRINLYFKPKGETYSNQALEKTRLTHDELYSRELSSDEGHKQFIEWLDKYVNKYDKKDKMQFIAWNSPFDEGFTRAWFDKAAGDTAWYGSYFWNPSICLAKVAAWYLMEERPNLISGKLRDTCQYAGIEFCEDDAHDALYDVEKTVALYRKLV